MADAGELSRELAQRDRAALGRELWHVLPYIGIEVHDPAAREPGGNGNGKEFADRTDAVHRIGARAAGSRCLRGAARASVNKLPAFHHRHRERRRVGLGGQLAGRPGEPFVVAGDLLRLRRCREQERERGEGQAGADERHQSLRAGSGGQLGVGRVTWRGVDRTRDRLLLTRPEGSGPLPSGPCQPYRPSIYILSAN